MWNKWINFGVNCYKTFIGTSGLKAKNLQNTGLWLVEADHLTWMMAPDWSKTRLLTHDKSNNSVKINRKLLVCNLLADAVGHVTRQNLHQSFTRELPHQVILKQKHVALTSQKMLFKRSAVIVFISKPSIREVCLTVVAENWILFSMHCLKPQVNLNVCWTNI